MQSKVVLSQVEVSTIIAAARTEAQKNHWAVAISIVDDGGHPLALERLDGCASISAYISTEKARSSALGLAAVADQWSGSRRGWRFRSQARARCRVAQAGIAALTLAC